MGDHRWIGRSQCPSPPATQSWDCGVARGSRALVLMFLADWFKCSEAGIHGGRRRRPWACGVGLRLARGSLEDEEETMADVDGQTQSLPMRGRQRGHSNVVGVRCVPAHAGVVGLRRARGRKSAWKMVAAGARRFWGGFTSRWTIAHKLSFSLQLSSPLSLSSWDCGVARVSRVHAKKKKRQTPRMSLPNTEVTESSGCGRPSGSNRWNKKQKCS